MEAGGCGRVSALKQRKNLRCMRPKGTKKKIWTTLQTYLKISSNSSQT